MATFACDGQSRPWTEALVSMDEIDDGYNLISNSVISIYVKNINT